MISSTSLCSLKQHTVPVPVAYFDGDDAFLGLEIVRVSRLLDVCRLSCVHWVVAVHGSGPVDFITFLSSCRFVSIDHGRLCTTTRKCKYHLPF